MDKLTFWEVLLIIGVALGVAVILCEVLGITNGFINSFE